MVEFVERLQHKPFLFVFLALTVLASSAPHLYVRLAWVSDGMSANDLAVFVATPMLGECFLVAVVTLVWRYSRRSPVFTIQWVARRRRTDVIGVLILMVAVIAMKAVLLAILRPRHISINDGVLSPAMNSPSLLLMLWIFVAVVMAPFAEELFWRGYVQGCLQRLFGNPAAIVMQGVLFALWHLRGFGGTLMLLPLGLATGIWRWRRGTLVPLMVTHAVLNGFVCLGSWRTVKEIQRVKVTHDYGAAIKALCTPSNADPNENARFAYERAAALLAARPTGLSDDDLKVWPADLPGAKMVRLRNWLRANEKAGRIRGRHKVPLLLPALQPVPPQQFYAGPASQSHHWDAGQGSDKSH